MDELTSRQARFVEEYLVDSNGTQAAIRAGYAVKGARMQGSRLLAYANVRTEIDKRSQERSETLMVTREIVLQGLLDEAHDKGEGSSQSARVGAWAHIGKHLGMFRDQVDHNVNGGIAHTIRVVFDDDDDDL